MRGPYGFDLNDNCQTCKQRSDTFFCQLSTAASADFKAIKSQATYPAGAVLFLENQDSRGIFVLCAGEVKMSITSSAGKTLILRIAKAGEILGLMSTMSGTPYEVTAETLQPCQVAFVRRDDFLCFVSKHPEGYQGAIRQLSKNYSDACQQLRTVALCASAPEKLARLLLDWSADSKHNGQIKIPLTHEEIAEFIGTTRETVTRTFSEFKSRKVVVQQGSTLKICDRPALEMIGAG